MIAPIEGFSKLAKNEKIDWLATNYTANSEVSKKVLQRYWNTDE